LLLLHARVPAWYCTVYYRVCQHVLTKSGKGCGAVGVDRGQHPGQFALLGGAGGAAGGGVGGVTIEYGVWAKWPESVVSGQAVEAAALTDNN
jgi:hypothetical protein